MEVRAECRDCCLEGCLSARPDEPGLLTAHIRINGIRATLAMPAAILRELPFKWWTYCCC